MKHSNIKLLSVFPVLFCIACCTLAQTGRESEQPADTLSTVKRDTVPHPAVQTDTLQKDTAVPATAPRQDSLTTAATPRLPQADSLQTAKSDTAKAAKWTITPVARLNFAQTGFFNWSAGGDNSVATNTFFTLTANYKHLTWAWDTKFDAEFGLVNTKNDGWKKSADKIHLSTIIGYTHNDKLYYSFLGEFKTQHAKSSFDNKYISTFMAPGYLNMGLGADYKEPGKFRLLGLPLKDFTAFFSPFIARLSFVLDDKLSQAGAFGVDPGERIKKQIGMGAKLAFKINPAANVFVTTTLNLFTPYADQFFHFVVDWDTMISMKINKYLSTTIHMSLKYDEKIQIEDKGPCVQFKEIHGLGVVYAFK
ncbi:MAG: DUF3078 domain-containing protein [Prevotellaceae bacterium]|jgi:hypothetical protein|nr:DUF3078 domain-containing protein [Prevotellaceae bacterium]